MRRNGYLWTSGVNLDTAVRFPDPDFLLEWKISAIQRRFPLISVNLDTSVRFADPDFLLACKISAIWRRFTIIIAFILYSECPPYFYFRFVWPTDLESIPHASTPTSRIPTKVEAPTPIRSWVMSDNVSLWLPLKMRTRPLRMRRITWPVSRGSKTITFLESLTPICLFTIQLPLGYDDD